MENESCVYFPTRCGLCKKVVDKDELQTHACLCNYSNIILNESGDLWPQLEDGSVMNSPPPLSSDASIHPKGMHIAEDIEELLIAEVKKRRELWDFKLPITSRSREVIASHWQNISQELNGILTPNAACKKWRNLKDSYSRIRNDLLEKKSGSAANKPIKWKFYEHMQFLHDKEDHHSTATNISNEYSDCASTSGVSIEDVPSRNKRSKRSDSSNEMFETITAIMREP